MIIKEIKMVEIGDGRAVIVCSECGKIIGVYYDAKDDQKILDDVLCIKCHNHECNNHECNKNEKV